MRSSKPAFATFVASVALLAVSGPGKAQEEPSFTLRYGILAGLTGDPASSGQAWNEAAKLGINQITQAIDRLALKGVTVELTDSQDSQGSPQPGVEAAQKLVNIDGVDVIIGDFYSSVTSAVATAVAMPNHVLIFTGGTSPALTKLNTGSPALLWQPVPADDVQGRVLARIIAAELGDDAKINVAARNDAYGTALSAVFKEAWTEGGGTIPQMVIYNHQQPTLDTEAQQLVQGNPDGWLFIDFCATFQKLALPLSRTGAWDPSRSFGSDTLNDCSHRGAQNWPGMRATRANASAGESFPAFRDLYMEEAAEGVAFESFTAEAFDSAFVAFLAALQAGSSEPVDVAAEIVSITNDPGEAYTFEQLDEAIQAVLAGEEIHFHGATGPINFDESGRVHALTYDIWQHQDDGSSKVVNIVRLQP
jgi:ABC-type branched-subunit amino acid transport system substrate-binding protein